MSAGLFNKTAVESGWFGSTASEAGWFNPDLLEEASNQPSDPAFIPAIGLFGGSSPASIVTNSSLTCNPASLSLTGSDSVKVVRNIVVSNSLTFTGSIANLTKVRKLVSTGSSLTLTGSTAATTKVRKLTSTDGTLAFTGSNATNPIARKLVSVPQSLVINGSNASFSVVNGSGTNYPLTCNPASITFAGGAAALVSILEQIRVFDTRYVGNNWIYEYAVYPPGWPGYYIVASNGGVSHTSNLGRGVSEISHNIVDNGDGTVTLNEQITVSSDKQDAVSHINYEVILS